MSEHPAYGRRRRVTAYAEVLTAANPGPMTLDGTNTWFLGEPDALVVVDPGPDDGEHLEAVAAAGHVVRILLTHRHPDHSDGIRRLHEFTGAPTTSLDPAYCHGGTPFAGGDSIEAGGLRIGVLETPGHTSDSVCLLVDGGDEPAVLTGDTILGRGTTVVAHPDGVLADYLASLERLAGLGDRLVLPGHGAELPSAREAAQGYLAHRRERLDQIRAALEWLGSGATAEQVVRDVYADVDRSLWGAAELSVRAQLEYLVGPAGTDPPAR